jgi:hypothetical protein
MGQVARRRKQVERGGRKAVRGARPEMKAYWNQGDRNIAA